MHLRVFVSWAEWASVGPALRRARKVISCSRQAKDSAECVVEEQKQSKALLINNKHACHAALYYNSHTRTEQGQASSARLVYFTGRLPSASCVYRQASKEIARKSSVSTRCPFLPLSLSTHTSRISHACLSCACTRVCERRRGMFLLPPFLPPASSPPPSSHQPPSLSPHPHPTSSTSSPPP